MSTEVREWIAETWEYCQEHWIAAAAVGGVLLILLISAILIASAKSEDAEFDSAPEPEGSEPEKAEEGKAVTETVEPQTEPVPASARGMVENLLKSVEAASGAAGQKVESIELKIEGARLTIHYAGFPEKVPVSEVGTQPKDSSVSWDFAGETAAEPAAEILLKEESVPPKKFGQDNMNTARSGRVYTEEELLDQIRD